jgi:hypothetical protein
LGECGDDSFTVRTHQTHIEAEKQSYIRSKDGLGPSATGPRNGPQRKIEPIVVLLPPSNIGPLANYTDRASSQPDTQPDSQPARFHFIYIDVQLP